MYRSELLMDSDSESIVESVREQVDTALEKRMCL